MVTKKIISLLLTITLTISSSPIVFSQDNGGSSNSYTVESNSSESSISDKELREAINNPEEFNKNVKDITLLQRAGLMTGEMAKFYLAVAIVEFVHCTRSSDPTACVQFMEGLKDPVGHVGFAIFMKANRMTTDLAQIASRGRINPGMAGYLGLAGGMLAQSVFTDIYYNPLVQELFKTSKISNDELRKRKRSQLLNQIWQHLISNSGKYLFDKIPSVVGLLGAAYVSHKTMQIARAAFGSSERLVKYTLGPNAKKAFVEIGKGAARKLPVAKTVFKYVLRGSRVARIHPVVALGSYLVETIVFLVWAPIIETFVTTQWDRSWASREMTKAKEGLEEAIRNNKGEAEVKKYADELSKGWDKFRNSIMNEAEMTKARHLMQIQKVNGNFEKVVMYYEWLIRGMDTDTDLYKLNANAWHSDHFIHSINEAADYAEDFFCGPHPLNAVTRKIAVHGLPMPGSYSFDFKFDQNRTYYENMKANEDSTAPTEVLLDPFKVYSIRGLCDSDIKRLNGGSRPDNYETITCPVKYDRSKMPGNRVTFKNHQTYTLYCEVEQNHARYDILSTGLLNGQNIKDEMYASLDEKSGTAMEKMWSQKDLMVMRFEKTVREEIITALTGRDVEIDEDDRVSISGSVDHSSFMTGGLPLGMISNYNSENRQWYEYAGQYPRFSEVFNKKVIENTYKKKASQDLLDYSMQDYSERVRTKDFFQEIPKEDWEKIVRAFRDFIIP